MTENKPHPPDKRLALVPPAKPPEAFMHMGVPLDTHSMSCGCGGVVVAFATRGDMWVVADRHVTPPSWFWRLLGRTLESETIRAVEEMKRRLRRFEESQKNAVIRVVRP